MTSIQVGTVDVVVLMRDGAFWRVLVLQRGEETRCPSSWEIVHGRIEAGEVPEDAALRELAEEAGLVPERLYSIRVQPIYLPRLRTVQLGVGFAAVVSPDAVVRLGDEHVRYAWLAPEQACVALSWPADDTAVRESLFLLRAGDAGALEDVLRIV